jgi:hypothetical protein
MTVLTDVLRQEGYASPRDVLRDWALLTALSRLDQYRAECEAFETKYHMRLDEFEHLAHCKKGVEDFLREGDIEDWQFCTSALRWWQAKVQELRGAGDS